MQFKTLASTLLVAAGVAQAQEVIPVLVGGSANGTTGFIFSPDKVTAQVGSIVQFQFVGGNHTVTQSTFDQPCVPISSVNSSVAGFHSGFIPAAASMSQGNVAIFNIQINDTRPLWLYCAQGRHCQNGMTMVINENPNGTPARTLDGHRQLAASVQQAAVPGAVVGGQGGSVDNNGTAGGNAGTGGNAGNNPGVAAAAGLRPALGLAALLSGAVLFL